MSTEESSQVTTVEPTSAGPSVLKSFSRQQVVGLTASAVDFCAIVFFVEVCKIWYVAATAMGAVVGAVTSFLLGRIWTFEATHGKVHGQLFRYAFMSGCSLLLNSSGVYLFTDKIGFDYRISKLVTATLVGNLFNFPMQRYFVFRQKS